MTSGFQGMDVGAVKQMATQFNGEADKIQGILGTVTNAINSNIPSNWKGHDATTLQQQWDSGLKASLKQVHDALKEAAKAANRNADVQAEASRT